MKRILVAGLGDSGVLTAIRLARRTGDFQVTGISTKPGLLSGQELGVRLARPTEWARDYWIPFEKFHGLDRVRTVQARLTGLDPADRTVSALAADGVELTEPYDALVISTGVSNGFWRRPDIQSADQISAGLHDPHHQLAAAGSVMVIGGGAAAVSAAANLAAAWPDKRISLYFPGERPLAGHHPRTWERVRRRLTDTGVVLHPGYRALLPNGFRADEITSGRVAWSTGQAPADADAVLWAVGSVRPNTDWLPAELLDGNGFVCVTTQLQIPGHPEVFAIGDVAATDPLRSSARNRADGLLAHNIAAFFAGKPLRDYRPPQRRWGSVLGVQADGLEVFAPSGHAFRFPAWSIDRVLQPWIVRRGIYRGIRDNR
jgi:apoptosis-inducing factor 2